MLVKHIFNLLKIVLIGYFKMFTRTAVYVICKNVILPASSQVSFRFSISKSRSAFSRGYDRLDLSSLPALAFVFCLCLLHLFNLSLLYNNFSVVSILFYCFLNFLVVTMFYRKSISL